MARLNTRGSTASSAIRGSVSRDIAVDIRRSSSSSPAASFSSDKENQSSRRLSKGKRPMAPPDVPIPSQAKGSSKRRRLGERSQQVDSQRPVNNAVDDEDKRYYDPEQNPEERRKVRHKLRLNVRELHDRADEFLNNDSSELVGLVDRQDQLMSKVKQTADATIDARFMIGVSDLALRRSKRDAQGDNAVNVDIDEWVSKCITFMKHGRPLGSEEAEPISTQARRNDRRRQHESDDEDDNDGNAMDWDVLGTRACFPANARPAVPSFLLGPLSVQKRVRGPTQRRATQRRVPLGDAAKPQEIKEADLERNENSSLTKQCNTIREQLSEIQKAKGSAVLAEASDDMDEDEARALFKHHGLSMNFEVPLFNFAVNPRSFGQTVENLFYLSFLVKDGYVAVSLDDDGLPTIREIPKESAEAQKSDAIKHQQILSLDFPTYRKLVNAFSITESMIPHRSNEEGTQMNARGWYG